jgi:hypothetical protein
MIMFKQTPALNGFWPAGELSGLAFDSLQCVFRPKDIATMYEQPPLPLGFSETIYIMIDPAAVRSPRLK